MCPRGQLGDRIVGLPQRVVVAHDGGGLGHHGAELLVKQVRVFAARGAIEQPVVRGLCVVDGPLEQRGRLFGGLFLGAFDQVDDARRDEQSAEDAAQQRVGAQAIGAMILIVALADGVEVGNIGPLVARRAGDQPARRVSFVVDPQPAHGVVDGGEDFHRHFARVDALELFVDFQNAAELQVECVSRDVRQVEIDAQPVALDAQVLVRADVEDFARGNVAGHEVAILRIALFEEVIPLGLGNLLGRARILRLTRHPHTASLAAGAFAHQPQLVGSGNGRGVHLDELGIAVLGSRLVGAAGGAAGADHRHRRAAIDQPAAPRGDDHRVGREGSDLHGDQVLAHHPAANARLVEDRSQIVPGFVELYLALDAPAAHLVVERIEQLLAGRGAGESRALEQRAAKATLVAKALGRAVEGDAEPIHQVDDLWRPEGHFLDRGLVLQEVAAVDRVVEVQIFAVALLARDVVDAVDASLAQTLCERLTGVRLIRSTSMPSSASFIAADRPASPPPTIITRGFDMTYLVLELE